MIHMNPKQQGVVISAAILFMVLFFLSTRIKKESHDVYINISLMIFGIVIGWLVGMLISPYNPTEGVKFAEYAGAISVFLSGYFISKVDGIITKLFSPEFLLTPLVGFRVIATTSSAIIITIATYVFRVYF